MVANPLAKLGLGTILISCSTLIQASSVHVTNIVDNTGVFSSVQFNTAINNVGVVSFQGTLGTGAVGVFAGNGGPITTIADSNGPLSSFGSRTSINDSGAVAFMGTFKTGGSGILLGSGGTPVTLYTASPTSSVAGTFRELGNPTLNNAGIVAFTGYLQGGGGDGVFAGNGGPVTTIRSGSADGITIPLGNPKGPAINKNAVVAFDATLLLPGGGSGFALFAGTGGPLLPIADTTGTLSRISSFPSINDSGAVAFGATLDGVPLTSGFDTLLVGTGGSLSVIADASGPLRKMFFASINNNGKVAFEATLDAGGKGLFLSSNVLSPVVRTGDLLFGSTLTDLCLCSAEGLNDHDQIVFWYSLADGRRGIAVVAVPESDVYVLMVVGLATLFGVSARRRAKHVIDA